MENFDVIVLGNGSGGYIAYRAAREGNKTALVDKPPVGGTCQNFGCKPSKMLINIADKLKKVKSLKNDGVEISIKNIDFNYIMNELRETRRGWQKKQKERLESVENPVFYESEGRFIDDYVIETDSGDVLKGDKIFIANGARPFIPPIEGVEEVDYLTNETILELEELPEDMVIIGGGYIGVEYAHFMSQMGTKVTIIQRGNRLVKTQDKEISKYLKKSLSENINIKLNTEAQKLEEKNNKMKIKAKTKNETKTIITDKVMLTVGRKPNSDTLKLNNTKIDTNEKGYIKVNKYLETTQDNTWALGDITGKAMFKHVANKESKIAWNNSKKDSNKKHLNYNAAPSAVFTNPEIGSVGLTERKAKKKHDILVGKANYQDIEKGVLTKSNGIAKAIVRKDDKKLLGFHIIGPDASNLIQESINIISNDRPIKDIKNSIHTFPTLAEIIPKTLKNLKTVK